MRHWRLPSTDLAAALANIWLWDMSTGLSHSLACHTVRGKVSEVISQLIYLIKGLSSNPLCSTILRIIFLLVRCTRDNSAGSSWPSIQLSHHQLNKAYLSLPSILFWHNWFPRCVRSFYIQHSSCCYMLAGWGAAMEAWGKSRHLLQQNRDTQVHHSLFISLQRKSRYWSGFWDKNVLKCAQGMTFKGKKGDLAYTFCSIIWKKKSRNNLL